MKKSERIQNGETMNWQKTELERRRKEKEKEEFESRIRQKEFIVSEKAITSFWSKLVEFNNNLRHEIALNLNTGRNYPAIIHKKNRIDLGCLHCRYGEYNYIHYNNKTKTICANLSSSNSDFFRVFLNLEISESDIEQILKNLVLRKHPLSEGFENHKKTINYNIKYKNDINHKELKRKLANEFLNELWPTDYPSPEELKNSKKVTWGAGFAVLGFFAGGLIGMIIGWIPAIIFSTSYETMIGIFSFLGLIFGFIDGYTRVNYLDN